MDNTHIYFKRLYRIAAQSIKSRLIKQNKAACQWKADHSVHLVKLLRPLL